jgi:hypothetical protein
MKALSTLLLPACLLLLAACPKEDEDTGEDQACWLDEPEYSEGDESQSIMETWGAPCETDADCVALLDDDAICAKEAVIYELPGGYCTKLCTVDLTPEQQQAGQTYEENDTEECTAAGGVNCIGANDIFSRCAVPCTSHAQCSRDGYACRLMPEISQEGDPTYCLMSECCEGSCGGADGAAGTGTDTGSG